MYRFMQHKKRAHGSVVGWGTMVQSGMSRFRVPMKSLVFFFSLPNPSGRTMALGSTQPLIRDMNTKNIPENGRPALKADNLTDIWAECPENVGASTSHNPMGLHGLLQG
jgi:hypothetical protein